MLSEEQSTENSVNFSKQRTLLGRLYKYYDHVSSQKGYVNFHPMIPICVNVKVSPNPNIEIQAHEDCTGRHPISCVPSEMQLT